MKAYCVDIQIKAAQQPLPELQRLLTELIACLPEGLTLGNAYFFPGSEVSCANLPAEDVEPIREISRPEPAHTPEPPPTPEPTPDDEPASNSEPAPWDAPSVDTETLRARFDDIRRGNASATPALSAIIAASGAASISKMDAEQRAKVWDRLNSEFPLTKDQA